MISLDRKDRSQKEYQVTLWSYIVDQWVLVNFKFKVNGLYKLLCFSGFGHGGGGQRRSMEQGQNCIFCVGFHLCLTQQIRIKEMGIMSSWSNWSQRRMDGQMNYISWALFQLCWMLLIKRPYPYLWVLHGCINVREKEKDWQIFLLSQIKSGP